MQFPFFKPLCIAVIVAIAGSAGAAFAHEEKGATGIVKERMDGMTVIKEAMAMMGRALKNGTAINTPEIQSAILRLMNESNLLVERFPDTRESRQATSQATDQIWSDWDRFVEIAGALGITSVNLAIAAQVNDRKMFSYLFRQAGQTCRDCHQDFRKPQH